MVVEVKLMPEGVETDLHKIQAKMKELGATKIQVVPIAFGLNALHGYFILNDSDGTEALEGKLSAIDGIQSVEVVNMSLI